MNTEINLLEQKPKKNLAFYFVIFIFIILIATTIVVLNLQIDYYNTRIKTEGEHIAQLEEVLREHNLNMEDEQRLSQVHEMLSTIQMQSIPNVWLYFDLTDLFNQNQLQSYVFSGENQVIISAKFSSLPKVADYVAAILERNYINDVDISNVNSVGESYQATLTISLDLDRIRKELGEDAD
ncbi:hypothetical protein [Ornithinibacillus sp. 179-J 7C1 HS]|uniref:hypothetical protein n=1 Tax=Ornithinibacillus sp. 179-J 7C1 HS TaxID=3142384 RepID=UPI0039A341A0